jgi:hypothetical protein
MKRTIKRAWTVVAAVAIVFALSAPASAGKGGSFGGMSRGGMSRGSFSHGGMSSGGFSRGPVSRGSANFGMTRSLAAPRNTMTTRANGGFSPGNFSTRARGTARPSIGQTSSVHNAARQFTNSLSRSRGLSTAPGMNQSRIPSSNSRNRSPVTGSKLDKATGHLNGRRPDRLGDLVKTRVGGISNKDPRRTPGADRITEVLGKARNSNHSLRNHRANAIESVIKSGRTHSGTIAKIDRNKLRDLVKGYEKVATAGSRFGHGKQSGVHSKLTDSQRRDRLLQFNSGGLFAGNAKGALGIEKNIVGGGCFPPHQHHHHHHQHGFDILLGSFWFNHCYGNNYYGQCWQPYYTYPNCRVTFPSYPEVVTVVDTQPIVIDQEIMFESATDESTADNAAAEEPISEPTAEPQVVLAAAKSGEPQTFDQSSNDSTGVDTVEFEALPVTEEPVTDVPATEPKTTSEFDVELVNVKLLNAGDREAQTGPTFQVTVRNAGLKDLERFLVSLVACKDSQIDSSSLHTSMAVEQLAAGEEKVLELTLPVESLSLNRDAAGRPAPFSTLIAAVDSDERVNEGDEENNLALIDRTGMTLASN